MAILIQDVINKLEAPIARLEQTVDRLDTGDASSEVKGIVITFMATQAVIEQAIARGANLIIAHEGSFYSHLDNKELLQYDPVYQQKQRLIEENGIAIYRFHDYFHRYQPDGIMTGLLQELGWEEAVSDYQPAAAIVTLPPMTVYEIAEYLKQKLSIPFVRVIGNLTVPCTRIGLLVGYRGGGATAIPLFEKAGLDLIIAGEGPEWETPEYVRDAEQQGRQIALIMLGHAQSEEPGMRYLAKTMERDFPAIQIQFISGGHAFQVV